MKTIQDQTNNYVINQKFKSNAFDASIHLTYFSQYFSWYIVITDLDLLAFQYQNDTMLV